MSQPPGVSSRGVSPEEVTAELQYYQAGTAGMHDDNLVVYDMHEDDVGCRPCLRASAEPSASSTRLLPPFSGDPLALGVRLCEDVQTAETGHLFIGPLGG